MKNHIKIESVVWSLFFAVLIIPVIVNASILFSQPITLKSGWNIISTPRVLDSYEFSILDISDNFDIYVLNSSNTSGWSTMADLDQTVFTPLFGYFINNKTGSDQILTFNYKSGTTPDERLFERNFSTAGWHSIGVANPSYVKSVGADTSDLNNPANVLNDLSGYYSSAVDFTAGDFATNPDSLSVSDLWQSATSQLVNSLYDFRETKGYAIFINNNNGLYSGFQNNSISQCADGIDNDGNGEIDYPNDSGCSSLGDNDETNTTFLIVSNSSSVVAQNISVNSGRQVLGGFNVEATGEAISVGSLVFSGTITGSGGVGTEIDDVVLVDGNKLVVAGPVDATGSGSTATVVFADTVTFPIGTGTYTLKGQLRSDFVNDQTITFKTDPDDDWTTVTGKITGNAVTPSPTTDVIANTMTVVVGRATINTSQTPVAQNVVAGTQDFNFANFQFDATASGEDVRFTSLSINLHLNEGWANPEYLTGCQLWDGSTALNTGSNIKNVPSTHTDGNITFTLDSGGVTIPKGTVKTLALTCDLSSFASDENETYRWNISAEQSGTGLDSGTTITVEKSNVTGSGQTMTAVSSGVLTIVKDNASPSYKIVAGGATNVELGKLKFSATNEDITLTKVALQLTAASSSTSDFVGQQVTLWDGTTQVGTASFLNTDHATSTLTSSVVIPKDGSKVLTIKGDLAKIRTDYEIGTQGALLKVNYDGTDPDGTQGVGAQSGTTISQGSIADTAVAGVRVFRAYPEFAKIALSTSERTLTSGSTATLYKFKIKATDADGTSDGIGIHQFVLSVATSSGDAISGTTTLTDVKVYAYSDAAFSTTVDSSADGTAYTSGQIVATLATPDGSTASGSSGADDNELELSSPLRIPAGETYYFKVTGVATITFGTGTTANNWVKTYIQGDSAYPSGANLMDTSVVVDSDANDDFVWSPYALTTSAITDLDWTNGYKVVGLPADGMDAETICQ